VQSTVAKYMVLPMMYNKKLSNDVQQKLSNDVQQQKAGPRKEPNLAQYIGEQSNWKKIFFVKIFYP